MIFLLDGKIIVHTGLWTVPKISRKLYNFDFPPRKIAMDSAAFSLKSL